VRGADLERRLKVVLFVFLFTWLLLLLEGDERLVGALGLDASEFALVVHQFKFYNDLLKPSPRVLSRGGVKEQRRPCPAYLLFYLNS
jgi:hypothetical protein